MRKYLWLFLVFIITIPAFSSLFNSGLPSMHDDQHVARLFLFHEGLKQGYWYPRWVDGLGFDFGYPLFNFYPPLIYYVAEIFHIIGFSLVDSIKILMISGFILASFSIFFLIKKLTDEKTALFGSVLYTYFFYHLVTAYVRGALAEFFSFAIIPLTILAIHQLNEKIVLKNSIWFGVSIALLILGHPLIAFPFTIFIGLFFLFFLILTKEKTKFSRYFLCGITFGLCLSAFFWLPSMIERKFTLVDDILLKELANYRLHFVYPRQLLSSLWGYGGSIAGPYDGLTFQLGKIHLGFITLALIITPLLFRTSFKAMNRNDFFPQLAFYLSLTIFSIFMTTDYSQSLWDSIKFLWYLQFPWRFLTFTSALSVVTGSLVFYFFNSQIEKRSKNLAAIVVIISTISVIGIYSKYAHPQQFYNKTDAELTSKEEISWRISRSSFEFAPKGVVTKKTDLGTTIIAIEKNDLQQQSFEIIEGKAELKIVKNHFGEKIFQVSAVTPVTLRLNTFNFPGWEAALLPDNRKLTIYDNNPYKLISLNIPRGTYKLTVRFKDTPVRKLANLITLSSIILIFFYYIKIKISVKKFNKNLPN